MEGCRNTWFSDKKYRYSKEKKEREPQISSEYASATSSRKKIVAKIKQASPLRKSPTPNRNMKEHKGETDLRAHSTDCRVF